MRVVASIVLAILLVLACASTVYGVAMLITWFGGAAVALLFIVIMISFTIYHALKDSGY